MTATGAPDGVRDQRWHEVRDMIAELLTVTPDQVETAASFTEELEVDSLLKIELLTRLEKRYGVEIPDENLASLDSLGATYELVAAQAER